MSVTSSTSLHRTRNAKAAHRTHNGAMWANAVGGMNDRSSTSVLSRSFDRIGVRAVYGSSDRAAGDHGSDPICRARETDDGLLTVAPSRYNGEVYPHDTHRVAYRETVHVPHWTWRTMPMSPYSAPVQPETAESEVRKFDAAFIVQRCISLNISPAEYCARIGLTFSQESV